MAVAPQNMPLTTGLVNWADASELEGVNPKPQKAESIKLLAIQAYRVGVLGIEQEGASAQKSDKTGEIVDKPWQILSCVALEDIEDVDLETNDSFTVFAPSAQIEGWKKYFENGGMPVQGKWVKAPIMDSVSYRSWQFVPVTASCRFDKKEQRFIVSTSVS